VRCLPGVSNDAPEYAAREAMACSAVLGGGPEAHAGATAIALATSWAAAHAGELHVSSGHELLRAVFGAVPEGRVKEALGRARTVSLGAPVDLVATTLGNGTQLSAVDTVPLALWCAARHLDSYAEATWAALTALGDIRTLCALVGGIIVLSAGSATIPAAWRNNREPLPFVD
jgi:ADP-ribosylglycohydrolase